MNGRGNRTGTERIARTERAARTLMRTEPAERAAGKSSRSGRAAATSIGTEGTARTQRAARTSMRTEPIAGKSPRTGRAAATSTGTEGTARTERVARTSMHTEPAERTADKSPRTERTADKSPRTGRAAATSTGTERITRTEPSARTWTRTGPIERAARESRTSMPPAGRGAPTAREVDVAGRPGLLLRPRGAKALLVLAHGAGAGMRHVFMEALATALAAEGVATLRWEFPYMAAGKARVDAPEVAEAAVRAAVGAGRRYKLPLFAGGKSFGGRMTSRAHAAEALAVTGLVFVGFPLHPPKKPAVERAAHLSRAMGPMLFLQGTRDDLADLALLTPIVEGIGADLHVIEGADHGLSRSGNIAELATTIGAWIDRLL